VAGGFSQEVMMLVEMLKDSRMRLCEDVIFSIDSVCGVTIRIDVPKGYAFDGASIPRIFWSLVGQPTDGLSLRAACIHDWMCDHAETYAMRRLGDTFFLHIMEDSGVSKLRRLILYLAVRFYGRFIWKAKQ